jgi:DNA-binding IclR family transcriptional regulator
MNAMSIQSIDRAANVLALLDQNTRRLSPALVAERLGLNRSTAHRYLLSLQHAGFLSSSFGPGPLLDQLASLASVRQQILALAPPLMRQLSETTGTTSVLSFLGRDGAVVTLVEEPREGTIILTVHIGTVLEPKAAQTRILLAFQNDPAVAQHLHDPLSGGEARVLANARRNRLAWADLDHEGLASAAVPILAGDEVQAAMALLGTIPMLRHNAERVEQLRAAGRSLSNALAGSFG